MRMLATLTCIAIWMTVSGVLFAGELHQSQLQGRVAFQCVRTPRIPALIELAKQEKFPVGIEDVEVDALRLPISVPESTMSLRSWLDRILPADEGFRWDIEEGVLHVTKERVPRGSKNLLDSVIPEFRTRAPITVQWASENIAMALRHQLDPSIRGFAGHFPTGDPNDLVGPFEFKNTTVRQLLNRVVRASPVGAAWIVRVRPPDLGAFPDGPLWLIVEYSSPRERIATELQALPIR